MIDEYYMLTSAIHCLQYILQNINIVQDVTGKTGKT